MTVININAPLEVDDGGTIRRATVDDLRGPRGYTSYDSAPVGAGNMWFARAAPSGWVFADGNRYTQASYPECYALAVQEADAGNPLWTYRTSDHSFTVPNLTDSFLLAPGSRSLGARGGEENHALTTAEMPGHTHSASITGGRSSSGAGGAVDSSGAVGESLPLARRNDTGFWFDQLVTVASTGGSGSHNNMPPFVVVPFIIKIAVITS